MKGGSDGRKKGVRHLEEKIMRQKIMEREDFTWDERKSIAEKSGDRCCRCGKKVYFGYGATVDHFVPLDKGGTNRDVNMVMLCMDCNEEKGNKIVTPEDYLPYLKKEHMEKLSGYFKSYLDSFEWLDRKNLLACDEYRVEVVPEALARSTRKKNIQKMRGILHVMKKAAPEDFWKLHRYFVRYLEKYHFLLSEEEAATDLSFWMKFGCVYFVEREGEIKTMCAVTATKLPEDGEGFTDALNIYVFCHYSTSAAKTIAHGIARDIPSSVMDERGLGCLPVIYSMVSTDELVPFVMHASPQGGRPVLLSKFGVVTGKSEVDEEDVKAANAFFARFEDVSGKLDRFFEGKEGRCARFLSKGISLRDGNMAKE